MALGDGDLRVRKSSVTDKIKARVIGPGNERYVTVWSLTGRVVVIRSYGWAVPVERAYSPVLRGADLPADTTVPWWDGRPLHFEFA